MLKDWPKVYEEMRHLPELDEHEKILYARSLAATPEERWQINVNYLGSLGLWGVTNGERRSDCEKPGKNWLPDMDLNHDKQIQSLLCYRYTIGQCADR